MMNKITILVLSGALLLLLLLNIGMVWFSSQPSFCKLCHDRNEYTTLEKSPHKGQECLLCHQEAGAVGFLKHKLSLAQMAFSYVFGKDNRPIKTHIRNYVCNKCHDIRIQKTLIKGEIRVSHKEFLATGARCVDCHNTVAHGSKTTDPKYPHMDACAKCHDGEKASSDCTICHMSASSPFRNEKRPTERTGPWAVTHGKSWKETHGMGNLATCQICHEPNMCARCHQIELPHGDDFPAVHGHQFLENSEACDRCHNRSFCRSCHKITMPHPKGFLLKHPKQAKKIKKEICYDCHVPADCDECHVRHTHPGNVDPKFFKLKE